MRCEEKVGRRRHGAAPSGRRFRRLFLSLTAGFAAVAASVLVLSSLSATQAQMVTPVGGPVSRVSVVLNKSESYKVDVPFADVLVGSSDIADVIPLSDRQLYILGKKVGTTNVTLYDRSKRLLSIIDIEVKLDTNNVENKIRTSSGSGSIRVGDVNGKLVLSGTAEDAQSVDRAMSVAKDLAPAGVVNAMRVTGNQQVMLKVRFVEASRDAARALGVRWDFFRGNLRQANVGTFGSASGLQRNLPGGGGTVNVLDAAGTLTGGSPFASIIARVISTDSTKLDVVISALEEQGVVRRLAEPNLIALSGETADFLAGGEFPVPVSATTTNGFPTTTIEFKEFGVSLAFTPTVLARGVISVKLEPIVSELDYSNAVRLQGVEIPGLVKRRAKTTVELRDGQSFAIAGLLQAQSSRTVEQVPWLGTVPVIGALFRSPSFQSKETELVVIVTPYLVRPVAAGKQLKTPFDTSLAGNDLDFFLNARSETPRTQNNLVNSQNQDTGTYGGIPSGAPAQSETRLLK